MVSCHGDIVSGKQDLILRTKPTLNGNLFDGPWKAKLRFTDEPIYFICVLKHFRSGEWWNRLFRASGCKINFMIIELEYKCILQANLQRSKLIADQLEEARTSMLKVLDHKTKIFEIINKHMSKRPIKKKERS